MEQNSARLGCEKMEEMEKWEKKLPTKVNIPKTVNLGQEVFEMIDVHVFGDPSQLGTCAVAYAVIGKPPGTK